MKPANKITGDDIKKIASMSNVEIESKLKDIISGTEKGAIKKMLSGVDAESLKKKIEKTNPKELEGFMGVLGKIDPSVIEKIKKSLT